MSAPTHSCDRDRFKAEMEARGFHHDGITWILLKDQAPRSQHQMEEDFISAILAAIHCPHEEAGTT